VIYVEMNLHSAITQKKSTLVTIVIINDGTGTAKRGNYDYTIHGRKKQRLKSGRIEGWPRQSKTACALLQAVINDAYPEAT
jgi:hypothetical protein